MSDSEHGRSPAALWSAYTADRTPEAEEALVVHYWPWVRKVIGDMHHLGSSRCWDDFFSVAMLALVKCIRKYQFDSPATFETYARTRVRGAVYDELRRMGHFSRKYRAWLRANGLTDHAVIVSIDDMSSRELWLAVDVPVEDGMTEDAELLLRAMVALKDKHPTHHHVLVRRFFEHVKSQDVASELGVTPSRVSQIKTEAIVYARREANRLRNESVGRACGQPDNCSKPTTWR